MQAVEMIVRPPYARWPLTEEHVVRDIVRRTGRL